MSERVRVSLLLAITTLVYANTLVNGFTLDDDAYILHNPSLTAFSMRGLFEPTRHNNVFRPTTFTTFALNWAIGGIHPWGYHLINAVLHAVVAFLLYMVLKQLLEAMPEGRIVAWSAALLFAVHPIHTEAVASISGRSELLAAAFLLAAWFSHLKDLPIPTLACCGLALLSKESAVVFAPLVVAGDYARGKLKPIHRYALIAGVTVLYLALLWKVQGGRFGEQQISLLDNPLAQLSAGSRILNAVSVAWKYVALQMYPIKLSSDYSYDAIPLDFPSWKLTLAVVSALLVLGLWVWALLTKRREWFLGGAVYLIAFATTANILVPIGTILGERLAYLPSAGFCLLLVLLWATVLKRSSRLAWTAFAIIIVLASARTIVRNQAWRDNFTLFSADTIAQPRSAKLHAMLGGQYMLRGQWDVARHEFETALQIYPDYPEVVDLCGIIESRSGQDAQALDSFKKALSIARKGSESYDSIAMDLAAALVKSGLNDEALGLMNEVIGTSPAYSPAWSNRATIHYSRGELERAREDATTALRLDPANTNAKRLLAILPPSAPNYR